MLPSSQFILALGIIIGAAKVGGYLSNKLGQPAVAGELLAGLILGFLLHGVLHLQPATIALAGATVLMLWGRIDLEHVLDDIEWTALFFFIGLFIAVETLVMVGIIEAAAQAALLLTGADPQITSMLLLWLSAAASGIVDNIPYTATMIPVVEILGKAMPIDP